MAMPRKEICENCPNRGTAIGWEQIPRACITKSGGLMFLIKNSDNATRSGSITAERFMAENPLLVEQGENCSGPRVVEGDVFGKIACEAIEQEDLLKLASAEQQAHELEKVG